jgi:hypothetical protein
MTSDDLLEFLLICKNGLKFKNPSTSTNLLLKISEFCLNENFSLKLISEVILSNITCETSLQYLEESYNKLNKCSNNFIDADPLWFELFYQCLDTIGQNLLYFINNNQLCEKIKTFDKKIIDEIFEKSFSHFLFNNFKLNDDDENNENVENYFSTSARNQIININEMDKIINVFSQARGCDNIFDFLIEEYMNLCSDENINDLNNTPNPTFQIKIPKNFDNYFNEFTLDIGVDNRKLNFNVFYKNSEDSFDVSFKIINSGGRNNKYDDDDDKICFKIFTFLSVVKMSGGNFESQINVKSISSNKSMHSIYKINNFKNCICKEGLNLNGIEDNNLNLSQSKSSIPETENYFTIKIYLKLCFTHSIMSSFLLKKFNKYYNEPNINKISKQLLLLILKSKYLQKDNEDQVVIALLNWSK